MGTQRKIHRDSETWGHSDTPKTAQGIAAGGAWLRASTVQPEPAKRRGREHACACAQAQALRGRVHPLHGLGRCYVAAFCSISRAFSC